MTDHSSIESNSVLRAFPQPHLSELLGRSQVVRLEHGTVLQDGDRPMKYVYFPRDGIVSQMIDMRDGGMIEVSIVGKDGAIGLEVATGNVSQRVRSIVTLPLIALRVPIEHMQNVLGSAPELRQVVVDYLITTREDAQQLAACGVLHDLEGRLSRWLLQVMDRCGDSAIAVTHEMLAQRLGVHRASMSAARVALTRAGVIDSSHRGSIRVINRDQLRLRACECYARRKRLVAAE